MATLGQDTTMPEGYVFLNPKLFESKKAWDVTDGMLETASKRDPDRFGMYIYNDFYSYAVLDLVDHQLSTIHARIARKEWKEAYIGLVGLTIFMDFQDDWTTCDDGDRVLLTNKTYGACIAAVLQALDEQELLTPTDLPDLATFLELAAETGSATDEDKKLPYWPMCRAYGKKLFGDSWDQAKQLHEARLAAWKATLEPAELARVNAWGEDTDGDEEDKDEDDKAAPWFELEEEEQAYLEVNQAAPKYRLTHAWSEYKKYLRGVPTKPLRGPPNWDLTRWTEADRAEFQGDGDDDDDWVDE